MPRRLNRIKIYLFYVLIYAKTEAQLRPLFISESIKFEIVMICILFFIKLICLAGSTISYYYGLCQLHLLCVIHLNFIYKDLRKSIDVTVFPYITGKVKSIINF